jgi:plastocyanin
MHPGLRGLRLLAAIAGLLLGSGCGGSSAGPQPARVAILPDVLNSGVYQPASVAVRIGQSVEWQNDSQGLHNVVFTDISMGASPTLRPHDRFATPFDRSGSYDYVCDFHAGMRGTVVVSP